MSTAAEIRSHLVTQFPAVLVDDLIKNYLEAKENFVLGRHREVSLYGGRFAEDAIRMLFAKTSLTCPPLGTPLRDFHGLVFQLSQLPLGSHHDSIRLFIPKALDLLYDVRNNRNVGHTGGDIDENYADANLSMTTSSWVLVELIRLYYTGDIDKAQQLVNNLIQINIPVIQDIDGFLIILKPEMTIKQKILALAYHKGDEGINREEVLTFLRGHKRSSVLTNIGRLDRESLIHVGAEGKIKITLTGIRLVEEKLVNI